MPVPALTKIIRRLSVIIPGQGRGLYFCVINMND